MLKSIACIAALTLGTVGAASAAAPQTYSITFDGYCDGMNLNVYQGIYTTGISTGPNCQGGGPAGAVEQGLNTNVNKFAGLVVTGNQNNAPQLYTYSLNLQNHKWGLYISNGTQYAKINSGTFTVGAAAAARGGKASYAK